MSKRFAIEMLTKILGLLLTCGLCAAQYACPTDLTSPCACQGPYWNDAESRYRVWVYCNGFSGDVNVFANVLKKLDNYEIDDLWINNYRNARLPDQPFTNTIIRRIIISNSPYLESFSSRSTTTDISFFTNLGGYLENLVIIGTANIRLEEWETLSESLAVNETAPGEGPALKQLILVNNGRSTVKGADSFSKLTQLQRITMRNVGLTGPFTTDLSVFPDLKFIDLSQNLITNFTSLLGSQTTTLYLWNNQIEIFQPSLFTGLTVANYIDVRANRLNCQCDYIQPIVDNQVLQGVFYGTCYWPPIMNGKLYGRTCFTSYSLNNKIRDSFEF